MLEFVMNHWIIITIVMIFVSTISSIIYVFVYLKNDLCVSVNNIKAKELSKTEKKELDNLFPKIPEKGKNRNEK